MPRPAKLSTRKQLALLLAVSIGGIGIVAAVAAAGIIAVRGEIVRLADDTSPTQIRLAKLERSFERISGDFARISAARSPDELPHIEAELSETIQTADRLSEEMIRAGRSPRSGAAVIAEMRRTGEQLRTISRQRSAARWKVAEASRNVTLELENIAATTQALSAAIQRLQRSSQDKLAAATQTSLESNTGIKALLTERVQTEQLGDCVHQAGIIDSRFRLNVLRDRADGILDTIATQELLDPRLAADLAAFVVHFRGMFNGDAGLLAARDAVLSHPGDQQAQDVLAQRQSATMSSVSDLSRKIAEEIDPLELAVLKSRVAMRQAADRIARVSSLGIAVEDVDLRARLIQSLAWKLLTAQTDNAADTIATDIARNSEAATQELPTIGEAFRRLNESGESPRTGRESQAFDHVRQLLIDKGGVASDVKNDLAMQRRAESLFASALTSIRQVTAAGSLRAQSAEQSQQAAVARIRRLSAACALIVVLVGLSAVLGGSLFGRRISGKVVAFELAEQNLQQSLREQAFHDPLTGLPNRLMLESLLTQALRDASAKGSGFSIFCVDLDRFKHVNDKMGHRVGDIYLIEIARRMRESIGRAGVSARVGGDEFQVLLTDVSPGEARSLAGALLASLAQPLTIENCILNAGGSIGIANFPEDGPDADTLVQNADRAMYRAKKSGRNQCVSFDWSLYKADAEHDAIQHALEAALSNGDFRLVYQPQYTAAGDLDCLEALLRFHHPKLGPIPPTRFIPMSEETGLIIPLGAWVLREVARQSAAWRGAGLRPVRIAVNVCPVQFAQSDFLETVAAVLRETDMPAGLLELELTEGVIMSQIDDARTQMLALRSWGVHIAIDDFGTGYSSLSYLHTLPVDTVKIDQSFVREIEGASNTLPLLQAIVSAAHAFGLTVVAEGVETGAQKKTLQNIGCDSLQGYLLARPLAPEAISELLAAESPGAQAARSYIPRLTTV